MVGMSLFGWTGWNIEKAFWLSMDNLSTKCCPSEGHTAQGCISLIQLEMTPLYLSLKPDKSNGLTKAQICIKNIKILRDL